MKLLQNGSGQNADSLAESCNVCRRTIFRDLEALRRSGVPLDYDSDRDCYSLPVAYFMPPTNFTADEALAVIAMATELGQDDRLPFYQAANSAAVKLENSLPAAMRDELKLVTKAIHIRPDVVSNLSCKAQFYQKLITAQATRRVVKIEYESLTEWETITTRLRPYRMLFSKHSWYVIARSSLHSEVRTFNLSRIASVELTDQPFVLPRGFSLKRYLRNAWRLIPGEEPDEEVVVKFSSLVARNVAEVSWHPTQRVKALDDGSLEYRVTVSGIDEIAWWILGYGDQAEVLAPKKLRDLITRRVRNMANIYGVKKKSTKDA